MLVRTVVDTSVLSAERLIFESPPILNAGIEQKDRVWMHHPGEILNDITAPTNEDVSRYEELVAEAKKRPDTIAQSEVLLESHHVDAVRK